MPKTLLSYRTKSGASAPRGLGVTGMDTRLPKIQSVVNFQVRVTTFQPLALRYRPRTLGRRVPASAKSAVAETLRKDLATRYGRSPGAIRARLLRLRCDPECPGHICDATRAAHLQQIYQAEYGHN